ncbi:bc206e27-7119-4d04-a43a-e8897afcde33 [Thermothielavioides terrestris]|uniref:Kinetochore protein mis14 n=2 Tax=Thermothielavioides terrestris TaxID=2587410 RepID=G2R7T5_THETT|nr:uncharacterized protein THITE_2117262 [Thermothielavioides terrestris NRRL 8126]AEO67994.1 hypothetical protein THITE_2117262 [Thermothielavioides terrestris NRRL 8126]SPQ24769.1 bc206e27-7119-4d04-a43a-e8897afcde33 [Thermothielavioides terrestris]
MDEAVHRRIELQSPEDLAYLIDNVRRAAADSINAAFPPVDHPLAGQEDELRNRIEQLVNDYIRTTFTLAAPNLTINGLPVDPAQFLSPTTTSSSSTQQPQPQYEYEPFDPRKRDRIEQLIAEEEDLLRSIAQLKRRAPRATAARWGEASAAGLAADEAALSAACARAAEDGAAAGRAALEGMGALERQAGVEARWRAAVEGLGRLKREMPAAVAKMERARVAAGYVSGAGR